MEPEYATDDTTDRIQQGGLGPEDGRGLELFGIPGAAVAHARKRKGDDQKICIPVIRSVPSQTDKLGDRKYVLDCGASSMVWLCEI